MTAILPSTPSSPATPSLHSLKVHWGQALDQLRTLIDDALLPAAFVQDVNLLADNVQAFKLAVPLVGKFSAGKSSLINAWLGQNLQAIDLGPCTAHATEFHFSTQPHLVLDWQQADGSVRTEQRPLPDDAALQSGQWGLQGQAATCLQRVQLHLNHAALAQFPEIVLVDTPGISAHDMRHTEAVASYLGNSVVFVLCVNESTLGEQELAFVQRQRSLGQSLYLLQCKQDLLAPGDRADVLQTLIRQAAILPSHARSCSAREGQLDGFADILRSIEADKAQWFLQKLGPQLNALLGRAQQLLQRQLAQDVSAEQLQAQQHTLRQAMRNAQHAFDNAAEDLMADVRGPVTRAVRDMVSQYLHSRADSYADSLLHGADPSSTLAADTHNAAQLAGEAHLSPRLLQAAQCIGAEVQRVSTSLDGCAVSVGGMALDRTPQAAAQDGFSMGSLLALAPLVITKLPLLPIFKVLGSLVTLIAPVLGKFFQQRDQHDRQRAQAQAQIGTAISQVLLQLDQQLPAALQAQSQLFVDKLRTQFQARLETDQQSLARLAADLEHNQQARQAKAARVQQALADLAHLGTFSETP